MPMFSESSLLDHRDDPFSAQYSNVDVDNVDVDILDVP